MRTKCLILAIAGLLLCGPCTYSVVKQRGPRLPLWKDNDTRSIAEPAQQPDSLNYDFLHAEFVQAPRNILKKGVKHQPAWNVNAWDEVPESSWFTNRNHLHSLSVEEIRNGPNRGAGPDLSGPLTILGGKTAGTSPGFGRTQDSSGRIYYIKLDDAQYPEMSTAAEVVGSRLFYAMGFFVPEEWIVAIRAEQLRVGPKAMLWDKTGRERHLTQADVDEVLKGAARLPDGRYRAVASLALPGKAKGGFHFWGTRGDDPNDLIPHEYRRELRGLRLLCAWLNHWDIRAGNAMDMYVEENGRAFLRHYLLDFGSTLGSASYFPKAPRMGFSYILDTRETVGPLFSLGIYQPRWREHPAPIEFPSVGRFESAMFEPQRWKPVLPVVAFDQMDAADAYWAAKIVMSFTGEQIRAAVHEGQFSDPRAEEAVVRTLLERQKKIGYYAMTRANPLDRFQITDTGERQQLEFVDLAVQYGFAEPAGTSYSYELAVFNQPGTLAAAQETREPRIPLGPWRALVQKSGAANSMLVLTVSTLRQGARTGAKPVTLFLWYMQPDGFHIRGWNRD
jgi:hypothetical protein